MTIKIELLKNGKIPYYATKNSSCADCYSRINKIILPNSVEAIPLGFKIELKKNQEMIVRARSGLSKNKIFVIQGIIDSDYRGEIHAIVYNVNNEPYKIKKHQRVAQCIVKKTNKMNFKLALINTNTERQDRGFGSTGDM